MSADISSVDGESADGETKLSTDEITPYCCWWVVSSRCSSGQQKHIPLAVRKWSDEIPNDPDIEPPARPLCNNTRDVPWIVKSHTVIPPGWVDDEDICDRCADVFLERVIEDEE